MLRPAPTRPRTTRRHRHPAPPRPAARKLVIVNGTTESAAIVEATLGGETFDMVFVASNAQAYSQIKREQPNLVVLCLESDHVEGFQVLSMLKLDAATRRIPVVTVSNDTRDAGEATSQGDDAGEASEAFFARRAPMVMN
jgi:CheY-like chemotaxis protein